MSIPNDAVEEAANLVLAGDGAFIGVALAFVAIGALLKVRIASSALHKIQDAPSVRVSDLRSLLTIDTDSGSTSGQYEDKLVIVRGFVEAKSSVDSDWKSWNNVLISQESGDKGVILQRTQTCIYHELRRCFRWSHELRSLFSRKQENSSSIRTVPFVLADGGSWPQLKYAIVNMDGSRHPLPLVTVSHHFQHVNATPVTFLQALFGSEYPVALVDEEKMLPLGKEISAVGFCSLKSGTPEITSSEDLPYFLSDMTKDQMMLDISFKRKLLLWTGVVLGSVAIGVLSYAAMRNWIKLKEWWQRRQAQQQNITESNDPDAEIVSDDDIGEVPAGEICVICLTRRRISAFVPCGHLVCCQRCALRVEREGDKKCPVCMQPFLKSVRIYTS